MSAKTPRENLDRFLELLGEGHTIVHAAHEAEVSRRALYNLREADEGFRAEWEDALEAGIQALEQEARRRAVEGTERPVYYKGEVAGFVRELSDTLLIFLLKAKRPGVYRDHFKHEVSGPGGGAVQVEHELGDDSARAVLRGLAEIGLLQPGPAATPDAAAD